MQFLAITSAAEHCETGDQVRHPFLSLLGSTSALTTLQGHQWSPTAHWRPQYWHLPASVNGRNLVWEFPQHTHTTSQPLQFSHSPIPTYQPVVLSSGECLQLVTTKHSEPTTLSSTPRTTGVCVFVCMGWRGRDYLFI